MRNWGHNEVDRTNEYTNNNITMYMDICFVLEINVCGGWGVVWLCRIIINVIGLRIDENVGNYCPSDKAYQYVCINNNNVTKL